MVSLLVSCSDNSHRQTDVERRTDVIYCILDKSSEPDSTGLFTDEDTVVSVDTERWIAVHRKNVSLTIVENLIEGSPDLRSLPASGYKDAIVYTNGEGNLVMVLRMNAPHFMVIHSQVERIGDSFTPKEWPAEKAVDNAELENYLFLVAEEYKKTGQ